MCRRLLIRPRSFLAIAVLLLGPSLAGIGCGPPPPPPALKQPTVQGGGSSIDIKASAAVTSTSTVSFPAADYRRLQVVVDLGRIRITTDPNATEIRATGTIELRASTKELAEAYMKEVKPLGTTEGDGLLFRIDTPRQWRNVNFANRPGSMSVVVEMTVPSWMPLDVENLNGPVLITGDTNNVSAKAVRGDVKIEGTVQGRLSIEAKNASLTIGDIPAGNIQCTDGQLTLDYAGTDVPLGNTLSIGLIRSDGVMTLPPVTEGSISVHGSDSTIEATLRPGSTAALTLVTTNGKVSLEGTPTRLVSQTESEVRANLGTPVGSIMFSNMNADIVLRLAE